MYCSSDPIDFEKCEIGKCMQLSLSFRIRNFIVFSIYYLYPYFNQLSILGPGCLPWPESQTYGCSSGEEWKALDTTMNWPDSADCETLCLNEEQDGCCYLQTGVGCYWKPGGIAANGSNARTITCKRGKL